MYGANAAVTDWTQNAWNIDWNSFSLCDNYLINYIFSSVAEMSEEPAQQQPAEQESPPEPDSPTVSKLKEMRRVAAK